MKLRILYRFQINDGSTYTDAKFFGQREWWTKELTTIEKLLGLIDKCVYAQILLEYHLIKMIFQDINIFIH